MSDEIGNEHVVALFELAATSEFAQNLTEKQRAFCEYRAAGMLQKDAYRKAYDVSEGRTDASIAPDASRLEKQDKISLYIDYLKDTAKERNTESFKERGRITKEWIREQLRNEAIREENPANARIRSLELLGKSEGMFEERQRLLTEVRSPEDMEKELIRKLAKLMPGTDVAEA